MLYVLWSDALSICTPLTQPADSPLIPLFSRTPGFRQILQSPSSLACSSDVQHREGLLWRVSPGKLMLNPHGTTSELRRQIVPACGNSNPRVLCHTYIPVHLHALWPLIPLAHPPPQLTSPTGVSRSLLFVEPPRHSSPPRSTKRLPLLFD